MSSVVWWGGCRHAYCTVCTDYAYALAHISAMVLTRVSMVRGDKTRPPYHRAHAYSRQEWQSPLHILDLLDHSDVPLTLSCQICVLFGPSTALLPISSSRSRWLLLQHHAGGSYAELATVTRCCLGPKRLQQSRSLGDDVPVQACYDQLYGCRRDAGLRSSDLWLINLIRFSRLAMAMTLLDSEGCHSGSMRHELHTGLWMHT